MKDFIKKNKFTVIAILIFLVILIGLIQVKNIFFPSAGKADYGNRLDGIKEVEITNSKKNKIIKNLEDDSAVKNTTIRINGRTIETIITVNDDVSVDDAKKLVDKSIETLNDKEKKYYDIQVFIKKTGESSEFPIIGYKHHTKDGFSFTKDRTGSE